MLSEFLDQNKFYLSGLDLGDLFTFILIACIAWVVLGVLSDALHIVTFPIRLVLVLVLAYFALRFFG